MPSALTPEGQQSDPDESSMSFPLGEGWGEGLGKDSPSLAAVVEGEDP